MPILIAKEQQLKDMIKKVNEDRDAMLIADDKGQSAVLMALSDYEALKETIYLLSSKANAERLNESIKEKEQGKLKTVDISELEQAVNGY
jgi:antitoxin YefM